MTGEKERSPAHHYTDVTTFTFYMLLFITQEFTDFFGGGVITKRNLSICQNVLEIGQVRTFLLPARKGGIHTLKEFATGYMMGLTKTHQSDILGILRSDPAIKLVFVDYSLLGQLVKRIKEEFPKVKVIVFFHNVEIVYFSSYLLTSKRLHHVIGLPATIANEWKSVKYADSVITLNQRDSHDLERWYKRSSDLILPTSLPDLFDKSALQKRQSTDPIILLFVGSRFFPNEQGMKWFIQKVLPHLANVKLYIVGKGFEALRENWNSEKVEVVGACQDLSPYYYMSDVVVAPIFTGSGMKTKVAEALMYGKTVLGTAEAFEGYEIDREEVGKECNSESDFIDFIKNFSPGNLKYNEKSRDIFDKFYNTSTVTNCFSEFIKTMQS